MVSQRFVCQGVVDAVPGISAWGIYRNPWTMTDQGWKSAERVLFTDRVTGP